MSHYLEKILSITDETVLRDTLKSLGFKTVETKSITSIFAQGKTWKVDFGISKNGICEAGFLKDENGRFKLVGDFYRYQNNSTTVLADQIGLEYGRNMIQRIVKKNGYRVVSTKKVEDGEELSVEI